MNASNDVAGWTVVGRRNCHKVVSSVEHTSPTSATHKSSNIDTPAVELPGWGVAEQPVTEHRPLRSKHKSRQLTEDQRVIYYEGLTQQCRSEVQLSTVCKLLTQMLEQTILHSSAATNESSSRHIGADIKNLVVYGLGSIEENRVSRYQLGLALCIREQLTALEGPPQLFDPAFTSLDIRILTKLGLQPLEQDEQGGRTVSQPTLFYLPHCEAWLCNNLLAANWSVAKLSQLVILGNSFAAYLDVWMSPSRPKGQPPEKLLSLLKAGAVIETPIPDKNFPVPSAFNSMSLHTFPLPLLQQAQLLS